MAQYGEPWKTADSDGDTIHVEDALGVHLLGFGSNEGQLFKSDHFVRRLVVCVNFCREISDEDLAGQIDLCATSLKLKERPNINSP